MSEPWQAYQALSQQPDMVSADAPPPAPPETQPDKPASPSPGVAEPWDAYAAASAPAPATFRGFVNAETGKPYNDAQEATYADLAKRGLLDQNATVGSEKFPRGQTDPLDLPKPGDFYVDLSGKVQQRPPDPWLNTAVGAATDAAGLAAPGMAPAADALPKDPRWEAMKNGALSGLLFGGKNELESGVASLPALAQGPANYLGRFDVELANRDKADRQSQRDFPIAYDSSAVGGAILPSIVLPEAAGLTTGGRLALNAGQGGLGGFLSTDGTWGDRAKGAGVGTVAGLALGEVLPKVFGALPRTVTPASRSTADATLAGLGVGPGAISSDTQATLDKLLSRGADPEQAARSVAASSLPTPVPLTLGQVTGLPGDQLAYNLALRGARGAGPAARAQGFARSQQDALRGNVSDIASSIAGAAPPLHGQGALGVSDDLNSLYATKKAGVDAAYEAARAHPAPAVLPKYDAQALLGGVKTSLADFDPRNIPRVTNEITTLASNTAGGSASDLNLRTLFNTRARLSNLRASNDPVEASAAGRAVAAMDGSINDALASDLFHGDPSSVQMWKDAIGSRRDFGELFDQGDLVDKLTQRTGTGGQRRLVVDPGDAANYILGRSDLGFVGRQNLYTDLSKVKSLVTPESWNSLRSEIFQRIANQGEGAIENGSQQFSGAKFQKAWNTAQQRDSRLIDTVFTPAEQQQVSQLAGVASRVTSPVKGGDNSSNTSVATKALAFAGNGLLHIMDALPLIDKVSGGIEHVANDVLTKRALRGQPVIAPSPILPLLPGRAGAYIGSRVAEPQTDR